MAATVIIGGKEYDVERDFSWEELMLVEELGGHALGSDGAFESMSTLAACVFVIVKRDEPDLTWEQFTKRPMQIEDERSEAAAKPAAKKAAKTRPTRAGSARR